MAIDPVFDYRSFGSGSKAYRFESGCRKSACRWRYLSVTVDERIFPIRVTTQPTATEEGFMREREEIHSVLSGKHLSHYSWPDRMVLRLSQKKKAYCAKQSDP